MQKYADIRVHIYVRNWARDSGKKLRNLAFQSLITYSMSTYVLDNIRPNLHTSDDGMAVFATLLICIKQTTGILAQHLV